MKQGNDNVRFNFLYTEQNCRWHDVRIGKIIIHEV